MIVLKVRFNFRRSIINGNNLIPIHSSKHQHSFVLQIVSMGRKKFSADFQLMFRLLKLFLFIGSVVTLGMLFYFLGLTVGDIFQSLLAFMPTGWAILQVLISFWKSLWSLKQAQSSFSTLSTHVCAYVHMLVCLCLCLAWCMLQLTVVATAFLLISEPRYLNLKLLVCIISRSFMPSFSIIITTKRQFKILL